MTHLSLPPLTRLNVLNLDFNIMGLGGKTLLFSVLTQPSQPLSQNILLEENKTTAQVLKETKPNSQQNPNQPHQNTLNGHICPSTLCLHTLLVSIYVKIRSAAEICQKQPRSGNIQAQKVTDTWGRRHHCARLDHAANPTCAALQVWEKYTEAPQPGSPDAARLAGKALVLCRHFFLG